MKYTFALLAMLASIYSTGAHAKSCRWSGGHDSYKDVTFEIVVSQNWLEISKCASQELMINGKWKFKREFKSKDRATWLEFRFSKDKYIQAIVDPDLLKSKGNGLLKFWYNNGDGFLASAYFCE